MPYLLLAISLGIAILSKAGLAWAAAYSVMLLVGYGWTSSIGVAKRLAINFEVPHTNLFSGEHAVASLSLANTARLPLLWLYIRQDIPPGLEVDGDLSQPRVITLAAYEQRNFSISIASLNRGIYTFGSLIIETGDILGMFRHRMEIAHGSSIVVYPFIHDLSHFRTPSRIPFGSPNSPKMLTEDPSWIRGVRNYIAGDPLSRIHWKATARLGHLQTKEIEPAVTLDSAVILDMDITAFPPRHFDTMVELSIEVAGSIVAALLSRMCNVHLMTNLHETRPIAGSHPDNTPEMLRYLAILQPGPGIPLDEAIRNSVSMVGMGGIVYVVTSRVTDECVDAAYSVVGLGRSPVIIHTCPRDRVTSRMANLNRSSVKYIRAQRGIGAQSLELIS